MEATKAEMGEVREENERLKTLLSHIVRDYKSLQMHFLDAVKVKERAPDDHKAPAAEPDDDEADEPEDLVSLSLGTRPKPNAGAPRKGHDRTSSSSSSGAETGNDGQLSLGLSFARGGGTNPPSSDDDDKASLALPPVLNLSSDSSGDEPGHVQQAGACPPSKACRSSSAGNGADDEVLQQQQQANKKARVSVRVKCDTPTMNDGCQWRKYGQKISKGNPCPRAYYRCTVAPNCPVRKQVQRCVDDMSILITTYEGTHSHPLPPAATAMASTTSAAAAMLVSGSTTSFAHHGGGGGGHHLRLTSAGAGMLGPTTISTASSCPTVTLDLTAPHSLSLMHPSSSSTTLYGGAAAGYEPSSRALPAAWSSGYLAYGSAAPQPYYAAKSTPSAFGHFGPMSMAARPVVAEQMYGHTTPYLQRPSGGQVVAPAAVTDTIAKAITSDPSFQSVLAAAITSYMGRSGGAAAQK
ncbi:hypothetical protein GUJ93_ZPchr0008g12328 [Zizania palustris]|uniref:WRKY domain-containing protein n=1 Tax=Zizania palustris TaxID=103762 RepID=A0A8J5VFM0_ZIZPA|nr:hypothetical protein GUJ93_ZPchr0008g12328 [Zizania palustris]KAG8045919.1 hypothetical protein GUJ93_ZPchr0008g12328 [Zizania palustris]